MHHIRRSFAIPGFVALVAMAACGAASAGSASASPKPSPSAQQVQVTLTDFEIAPAQVSLHQHAVVFRVANRGRTPHNLTLRNASGSIVGRTRDLAPGQSATLPLTLTTGTYTSFCSLPGHESLGMRGTVTVDG